MPIQNQIAPGCRVQWADTTVQSVPAYASMLGTVVVVRTSVVWVVWDCDRRLPDRGLSYEPDNRNSRVSAERLRLAKEGE